MHEEPDSAKTTWLQKQIFPHLSYKMIQPSWRIDRSLWKTEAKGPVSRSQVTDGRLWVHKCVVSHWLLEQFIT